MASLYERMRAKMAKTKDNFFDKIQNVMYFKELDDDFFEELEESLILSDLGIETATTITDSLKERVKADKVKGQEDVLGLLNEIMSEMVRVPKKAYTFPVIILIVGVNGVGKTTTIAKLAQKYKESGKKVMVAAADTFRAAATEQLDEWASRVGVEIVKAHQGADPSAVVFDAIGAAKARGTEVLICDTAGRLHNKVNLMKELEKVTRTIQREGEGFATHNLLVLDGTTGQNALNQAKTFNDAVHLDGIVMTKMDGTAKGGVVISIINELKIPVEYVGIGEQADDLIEFSAEDFVRMLYDNSAPDLSEAQPLASAPPVAPAKVEASAEVAPAAPEVLSVVEKQNTGDDEECEIPTAEFAAIDIDVTEIAEVDSQATEEVQPVDEVVVVEETVIVEEVQPVEETATVEEASPIEGEVTTSVAEEVAQSEVVSSDAETDDFTELAIDNAEYQNDVEASDAMAAAEEEEDAPSGLWGKFKNWFN